MSEKYKFMVRELESEDKFEIINLNSLFISEGKETPGRITSMTFFVGHSVARASILQILFSVFSPLSASPCDQCRNTP